MFNTRKTKKSLLSYGYNIIVQRTFPTQRRCAYIMKRYILICKIIKIVRSTQPSKALLLPCIACNTYVEMKTLEQFCSGLESVTDQKHCRVATLGAVAPLCVSSNKKACLLLPPAATSFLIS